MFGTTWKWAGKFRHTNKNIGIFWEQIPVQLKLLLDDVIYQVAHDTYSLYEIAIRLHHRLVSIHLFPNGNGRHARLYTDAFLVFNGDSRCTWGSLSVERSAQIRDHYIASLRAVDKGAYNELLTFARS